MAIRKLKHLVDLTFEHKVSRESMPSSLGTALLQHMCTAIPTEIADDVMECMQTSHDIITSVMTQVL